MAHLENELRPMSDQVRRLRSVSVNRTSRLTDSIRDHLQIMDAIEQNNAQLAETLMRANIDSVRLSPAQALGQTI